MKIPSESFPNPQLEAAITAVWNKSLPVLRHRVSVLQRAVAALHAGDLDMPLREEALLEAHRMAGLLGTFGYPEGTDAARLLELALDPELEANQQARHGMEGITSTVESAVATLQQIVGVENPQLAPEPAQPPPEEVHPATETAQPTTETDQPAPETAQATAETAQATAGEAQPAAGGV